MPTSLTPRQRAERLVTLFNSDGAALSNTDENYLEGLIAADIENAQQDKWMEAMQRLDGIKEEGIAIGRIEEQNRCSKIAEEVRLSGGDAQTANEIAARIREGK